MKSSDGAAVVSSFGGLIRFSAPAGRFVELFSKEILSARKEGRIRLPSGVIKFAEELVQTTLSRWGDGLVRYGRWPVTRCGAIALFGDGSRKDLIFESSTQC